MCLRPAKKNSLNSYRLLTQKLPGKLGKKSTNLLIHEIAPNYTDRNGGYTRIIKLDNRKNDNAEMSLIEFVGLENLDKSEEETISEDK